MSAQPPAPRWRFLPWLTLLALALRLLPILLLRDLGIGLDDMFQYDMLARSIATGQGYRWYAQEDLNLVLDIVPFDLTGYDPRGVLTSFRPPLYPAFLALVYLVAGLGPGRLLAARITQAFLNAALVPLTYVLARRFFPGSEKAARFSAWIVALYPMLVIYPLSLATENLFFFLVLASTLALLALEHRPSVPRFLLAGLLLGLTSLTRSVFLAASGLAVLWVWFGLRQRRGAILVFLAVALTVLPWMARNTLLHGRLTGIESALGYDLYVGYHPQSTGTFQYGISLDLIPMLDDGLRDRIGVEKALEFIRADPGRVPYLAVRRLGYFFGLERRALTYFYSNDFFGYIPQPTLTIIAAVLLLPFVAVSLSAAFGLALVRPDRRTVLLVLVLLGYLAPHVLILGEDRFHLTLVPFLAMLAGQCWAGGMPALRARLAARGGRIALALAALVALLLLFNWGAELWRDADMLRRLFGPEGNRLYLPY